jgi:hypothetical protein
MSVRKAGVIGLPVVLVGIIAAIEILTPLDGG